MASRSGMAKAITIATALSIAIAFAIPKTIATIVITEGREAAERTETDQSGEKEESIPLPSLKTIKKKQRNKTQNKQLLSLIWGEGGDSSAIPFPAATKNTKAIRKNLDLWSLFFGRWDDDAIVNNEKDDGFKEDKERIRETLKKFYGLADPKFARASLASVTRKNNSNRLPGSTAMENSFDLDKQDEADDEDEEQDELLPGTVLQVLFEDDAYELVERIQMELGATPQHYMDFAYTSVTASSYSSSSSSPSSSSSSTSCTRGSVDNLLISGEIDVILGEDQRTCNSGILTTESSSQPSFAGKGEEDGDNDNDGNKDSDRAMEFFAAWWKWWLPFANSQWWKDNGSSKADYDMGKSPFAGGSNGEVWRGHRICHRTQRPSSHDSRGDHGNDSHRAFFNSHRQKEKAERYANEDDDYSEDDWADEEFDEFDESEEEQEEFRTNDCDDQTPLVLKRLRVERGYLLLEAGLREVYFGKLIARVLEETKQDMYTVYVDHFFREVPRRRRAFGGLPNNNANHHDHHRGNDLELWIVYEDAGPSLRSYIYSPIVSDSGFVMYQHSKLWTKLRTFAGEKKKNEKAHESDKDSEDWESPVEFNRDRKLGRLFMQQTLREILAAAAELHKRGIVHRDIKPSNVMCQSEQPLSTEELFESETLSNIVCKLGDFSSGWDRYTSEHLYTKGPTPGEQTDEYAPPESYVGPYWKPFDDEKPQSYDSWSIGVLALELLLGTPNVFSVDQRTSALLTQKLKRARASDDEIAYALYLAALSNFCIFVPSNDTTKEDSWPLRYGDPLHKTAMVKGSCTLQDFHRALRARDPLGIGFDSSTDLLLHLIWQLLAFDPSERKTAEEALRHPYFISPDGTLDSLHHIPGYHNALISEMFDDRIDFDVEDDIKTFACPSCGRVFHDWRSCHQHTNLRKHAKFCVYNHTVLPSCINTHSMLPEHPTSGYCDLQGRRKTIEDFHSIHLHHEHQFYGIFDGHTGNLASKFAASELYTELLTQLPDLMQIGGQKSTDSSKNAIAADDDRYAWKEDIRINVTKAFETVHERFLDRITTMTSAISEVGSAPKMDQSGTTATALLVTQDVVIVAVLGDSRGVLASAKSNRPTASSSSGKKIKKSQWNNFPEVSAIPFSIDHVASDPTERDLVVERGGFVTKSGDTARVNGTLAITRSIGDANLAPVLSREPHVQVFDRSELRELCGNLGRAPSSLDPSGGENEPNKSSSNNRTVIPCFAILASDGLWDVMSNQEAVDMVVDIILRHNEALVAPFQPGDTTREVALFPSYDDIDDDDEGSGGPFQESAERLAVEAYVRGSTDNIGVCVVAID